MFKSRRAGTRRCKETRLFANRGKEKHFTLEGNSNITSNRVTIPPGPGFLSLGVKSRTVRRDPNCTGKNKSDRDRECILTEDLHGLFNENQEESFKKPRRSARISKKPEDLETHNSSASAEYHSTSIKSQKSACQVKEKLKQTPYKNRNTERRKSKSIFREINERWARAQSKKSKSDFNYPIYAVIDSSSKVEHFQPSAFCRNLSEEICVDLTQNDYLLKSKLAVAEKIRDINERLSGKRNPSNTTSTMNEKKGPNDETSRPFDFQPIPKRNWIFRTPPRQRIILPKMDECAIQPAVIYTTKKQSNIYELTPNATVDLTGYSNRQSVDMEGRHLRHLASFDEEKSDLDFTFKMRDVEGRGGQAQAGLADNNCSMYGNRRNMSELTYHRNFPEDMSRFFTQVVSRPTKTVKKMSRVSNFFNRRDKGNLDITPTGVNLFQSIDELERDLMFVEDDGEFKFGDTSSSTSAGNNLNFNFRKNLFKIDDDKMFNFGHDEPKMFDFNGLSYK